MCGIVGAVAQRQVEKILIEGLKRLEYRGYDSAGITLLDKASLLNRLRVLGKVGLLEQAINEPTTALNFQGTTGIAHTRWATHGIPSEVNAHPFISHDEFALVHNGIIENHDALRLELLTHGYSFSSQTDSEVVVHYVHYLYQKSKDLLQAVQATVAKLQGAYALALVSSHAPQRLIAVRHGCPLVIGRGIGENFIASDVLALIPVAQEFTYLEDGDIADINENGLQIYNIAGEKVERSSHVPDGLHDVADRGEYRHYMRKEIAEQPESLIACLEGRISDQNLSESVFGLPLHKVLAQVQGVHMVACGTAYHAALVGKYWIEALTGIPVSVEIASEYRYRKPVVPAKTLFVTLSQSGETADTLAALRLAKQIGYLDTLAICNVPASTLTRESAHTFLMRAGMEIGVASTKAFTTQLLSILMLALALEKTMPDAEKKILVAQVNLLPQILRQILELDAQILSLSAGFMDKHHAIFLGRGALFPIALEGALKLKEISYIHAEGYPGGELKHGPLALVDRNMPVIVLAPKDALFDKIKSNLAEVQARGGQLYVITDAPEEFSSAQMQVIAMPSVHPLLAPIAYTVPLQLLAYHVAVLKGTDVDQPRNLAKSVTVE